MMRLLIILLGLALLTAGFIVVDGLRDTARKSDVAIVLGSRVEANGVLSPRLKARVDAGLSLYHQQLVRAILVSGGRDPRGGDEAQAMKAYLLSQGVPSDAILTDSLGHNTAATARNSVSILQQHGFHSAIMVSQYYHLTRTRLAMHRCTPFTITQYHARYFEPRDVYAIAREVAALYYYLLFEWRCGN